MAGVIKEIPTASQIPQFVPFGQLYYAQDTGNLWIGTGFSTGSDFTGGNPGPNVNVELVAGGIGVPGGFAGDIQYNNGAMGFGGSAATVDALGNIGALSVTATSATFVTATVTGTLGLQTAVIVDSLGKTGTIGQALESTGIGVVWSAVSSGSGTVTSFSAGNLSPLFTTLVTTATTTPALTFSLSNAGGGTVFGNPTATAGAPAYISTPVLGVNTSTAGTLGLATSTAAGATITLQNTGALAAYNFNLPTTVGAAGSVLASQGGGSAAMTWITQALLGVAWSSLANPSANLTLSMGNNTTTFDHTTNAPWIWANTTTATAGTTNASPVLTLESNYWTGAASAIDGWELGQSLAAGTNGTSTLTLSHFGSATGIGWLALSGNSGAGIQFAASPGYIDVNVTPWVIDFTQQGGTIVGSLSASSTSYFGLSSLGGGTLYLLGSATTGAAPAIALGNASSFTATSGAQFGVALSGSGTGAANGFTFAPSSGTATFTGLRVNPSDTRSGGSGAFVALSVVPAINQSGGTGNYTALRIGVIETAVLGAANFLISAQAGVAGTTVKFSVDNAGNVVNVGGHTIGLAGTTSGAITLAGSSSGSATITAPAVAGTVTNPIAISNSINLSGTSAVYQAQGTPGVTQAAEAVGTIATTGGIVTTFTAVSDERLKISRSYDGGLAEILSIFPIRYRWNEKGQSLSGQTGDRDYIGFSAQNVERSIPEAIQSKKGPEQYLSFDDRPVIAALVNAVKTLEARIKVLENE